MVSSLDRIDIPQWLCQSGADTEFSLASLLMVISDGGGVVKVVA